MIDTLQCKSVHILRYICIYIHMCSHIHTNICDATHPGKISISKNESNITRHLGLDTV
jgi:hypothetical protein